MQCHVVNSNSKSIMRRRSTVRPQTPKWRRILHSLHKRVRTPARSHPQQLHAHAADRLHRRLRQHTAGVTLFGITRSHIHQAGADLNSRGLRDSNVFGCDACDARVASCLHGLQHAHESAGVGRCMRGRMQACLVWAGACAHLHAGRDALGHGRAGGGRLLGLGDPVLNRVENGLLGLEQCWAACTARCMHGLLGLGHPTAGSMHSRRSM